VRVLIGLDRSEASQHAARVAVELLSAVPDVEYLCVNVDDTAAAQLAGAGAFGSVMPLGPVPAWPPPEVGHPPPVDTSAVPEGEVLRETGEPVTEICRAADEHQVDLIVVGSHHKGVLERLVDPSVLPRLLRCSTRPVLVVPAPD
jgi:nucleotide-binding universal stress UspA family protein